MKTDREVLEDAITLIEDPSKWTQGAFARDGDGDRTDPLDPKAQTWCARGALRKVVGCRTHEVNVQLSRITHSIFPDQNSFTSYNDTHLHGDVILAMKRGLDEL